MVITDCIPLALLNLLIALILRIKKCYLFNIAFLLLKYRSRSHVYLGEQLTHRGETLAEIEKHDRPLSDDEEDIGLSGNISADIVAR